jgi:hypothetical protein
MLEHRIKSKAPVIISVVNYPQNHLDYTKDFLFEHAVLLLNA